MMPFAQFPQPLPAAFPGAMPAQAFHQQRPAFYPQIIYWYPSPPISPQTYLTNTGPAVIVMRGLPFNATVQDILNFFQGFPEVRLLSEIYLLFKIMCLLLDEIVLNIQSSILLDETVLNIHSSILLDKTVLNIQSSIKQIRTIFII